MAIDFEQPFSSVNTVKMIANIWFSIRL